MKKQLKITIKSIDSKLLTYTLWVLALGGTFGSLAMSQVYRFIPCELCWYQRIFMFPLPIIIAIGIYHKDRMLPYYVLSLSIVGSLIAAYHWLSQMFRAESLSCANGVSCGVINVQVLGFATIPFGSLVIFASMSGMAIWLLRKQRNGEVG